MISDIPYYINAPYSSHHNHRQNHHQVPERRHSSTPTNQGPSQFNSYISSLIQITIESLNNIHFISSSKYNSELIAPSQKKRMAIAMPASSSPLNDPLLREEIISIMKKSRISYSAHLTSLLYLRRFYESISIRPTRQRFSNYQSLSCLLVTSMILSSKFLLDSHIKNSDWSDISGFSLKDLNRMEINFLSVIRYDVMVSDHTLERWITHLSTSFITEDVIGDCCSVAKHNTIPNNTPNTLTKTANTITNTTTFLKHQSQEEHFPWSKY